MHLACNCTCSDCPIWMTFSLKLMQYFRKKIMQYRSYDFNFPKSNLFFPKKLNTSTPFFTTRAAAWSSDGFNFLGFLVFYQPLCGMVLRRVELGGGWDILLQCMVKLQILSNSVQIFRNFQTFRHFQIFRNFRICRFAEIQIFRKISDFQTFANLIASDL